jgi:transposase InsO family protein
MKLHARAALTLKQREELARLVVDDGWTIRAAAERYRVMPNTASKWVHRYRADGVEGLRDRSSRPERPARQTPDEVIERVKKLRGERRTMRQIVTETGLALTTVRRILLRHGMNRLKYLDPPPPARRYEASAPGELLHLDIKKLGRIEKVGHRMTGDRTVRSRGAGWEFVFVAIDDHTRIGWSDILPNERADSAVAFLQATLELFAELGVRVQRVMTDNGACFRSHAFAALLRAHGIRHTRTKPYTPRTNGKAERFIQTLQREWAYARTYTHSRHRAADLPRYLHDYNFHREHGGIGYRTPISRLNLGTHNLMAIHT